MANVVIASNDTICQSAKNWFIKQLHYLQGPPIDVLEDGETLIVIAHDHEFKDGTPFIEYITHEDFPMVSFEI